MDINKRFALIVAGGSGTRMKSAVPKQFMPMNGRPVLMHSIERFFAYDPSIEVLVVLPASQFDLWHLLCEKHGFALTHRLVAGGNVRFESVKNGLAAIDADGIVAIHDGVRPLVSNDTIDRCFKVTAEKGNATAALPIVETIRKVDGEQNEPVDRSHFVGIQTPQTFRVSEIKEAYLQPYDPAFTDDSMVLERWGRKIFLVDGNRENIKITHLSDLVMAEALQRKEIDDKGKSNP